MYYKISNGSSKLKNKKPQHIEDIVEHGYEENVRFLDNHPFCAKNMFRGGE